MKRKRLGKDLQIRWSIVDRDHPFMIEGLDITLYLKGPVTKTKIEDFTLIDNRICWVFLGKRQKHPGIYSLELVINEGKEGMTTTDACSFVELTDCSCKEGGISASNIEIESLDLTSVIEFNYDDSSIKKELAKKADKGDVPTKMSQLEQDVELGTDSPIVKGEANNSAVLEGEYEGYSNRAISQTSMAVGAGTIAGLKGWYYSKIDFTNKKITLSDKPTYIHIGTTLINGGWSSGTPNIKVGDKISLVNNSKYDYCGEVESVNGNVITYKDELPFSTLTQDNGAMVAVLAGQFSDGYSIYLPDRPDAGIIDFGGGAFAEGGYKTSATNICAHAEGLETHAYGQYAHAEGKETKAGYAAHAEGQSNQAIGTRSHAEGYDNIAKGNGSHVEGQHNTTNGQASHAEGYYTKTTNVAEHAEGKYNLSTKGKTIHSVGIGTSDTERKNAHEITTDGRHFIFGIGGYDGTNLTESKDVATAFSEKAGIDKIPTEISQLNDDIGIQIRKDTGPNSAALKNRNNKAISEGCVALGANNIAGFKGWYYGAISKVNDTTINVYLSSRQVYPKWNSKEVDSPSQADLLTILGKGTIVTLFNDDSYSFKINNGRSGMVQLTITNASIIPFDNIASFAIRSRKDFSICYLDNPTIGESDLAYGAFADGYYTKAYGDYSHAEGYYTKAYGDYSHAEGASTATNGRYSHAEGYDTEAYGDYSHAEGYSTYAYGDYSHAEGYSTNAYGKYSHAEGYFTVTTNSCEHASGRYNKSVKSDNDAESTSFSHGIGTSSVRKNGFECRKNGDFYIAGITQSLQDYLTELETRIKALEEK